jgi:nucleoside-diphosphate-sugar epimerase
MKISILGTGWLGRPLAVSYLKDGWHVKGSTTSTEKLEELAKTGIEPFLININHLENEFEILNFLNAEVLVINITSKNIQGFERLIYFIEKSAIQKVLFISSTSVYPDLNEVITEETKERVNPEQNPLVTIEELLQKNHHFQTTILRFGGLIGYNRKPGNFFKSGRKVQNPEAPVNLIHQDDCINIIKLIVEKGLWGQEFNCCTDTHPTKKEFYSKAAEFIGNPIPEFDETSHSTFKIISNEKIKKALNYSFIYQELMKYFEQEQGKEV